MNTICFSDNLENVKLKFSDYMAHYFKDTYRISGIYDDTISFEEKEKKMNTILLSEISKLANIPVNSGISKESWASHPVLKWAAFAVVNALIDMVLPDTIDKSIGIYTEQRYIGWGDGMVFEVEPNDLFLVSKHGRNQRTVEFEKQFNTQVSIIPENREITVAVSLYRVLCGLESLAKFVAKAIISIETQITRDVYKAFDDAMGTLPNTPSGSELRLAGWDEDAAIRVANTVSAFNFGQRAIFVGTNRALRHILPKDANYRYFLDSEYVQLGYLRNFMGYDTLVLPQVADWENKYNNGTYQTAIRDDVIYIISPASKPVKLVYEGATRTVELPYEMAANLDSTVTINTSYGTGIATNHIAGVIEL